MSLLYKEDWEEAQERYKAWWAHESIGRCGLAVRAPRASAAPEPPKARTIRERWWDLDWISRSAEHELSSTYFGGEALPVWNGGYPGHTCIPAFLGSPVALDWDTGWLDPILKGEDLDLSTLALDEEGECYRFALRLLRRGVQEARGKALVSIGAFGGGGDCLAALRGTERLLFDCIERPEQVRAAEEWLMDLWFRVYDAFYDVIREADQGSTCWFTLWSPGRFYAAQNDFSYNISPAMFRELFLPVIERQTRFLDHTIYHVDGVNAFVHIDALLELPRLQAFQVLPGAGKPNALHYMDALKKVQAAGRNLWITLEPGEVRSALAELSARGLFIDTTCATEEEARLLLRDAERLSKDR